MGVVDIILLDLWVAGWLLAGKKKKKIRYKNRMSLYLVTPFVHKLLEELFS